MKTEKDSVPYKIGQWITALVCVAVALLILSVIGRLIYEVLT